MKIGILTFCYAFNHGSLLQAYATKKIFECIDPNLNIKIIPFAPAIGFKKELKNNFINIRPDLSIKLAFKLRKFAKMYLKLGKPMCVTDDIAKASSYINSRGYDMVLSGSDSVLESRPKNTGYVKTPPNIFWLPESLNARKVIWCASADRSTSEWHNTEKGKKFLVSTIKSCESILLRDHGTYQLFLDQAPHDCNSKIHQISDPTFFLSDELKEWSRSQEINNPDNLLSRILRQKYAIIDIKSKKISSYFKEYCNLNSILLVAVNKNKFANISLRGKIDPRDWALLHYHSYLTLTNRFHGSVFTIMGQKPLVAVDESDEYSKSQSISKKCSLMKSTGRDSFYLTYFQTEKLNYNQLTDLMNAAIKFKYKDYSETFKGILLRHASNIVINQP